VRPAGGVTRGLPPANAGPDRARPGPR
jgi:hypothetical protein